MFQLFRISKGSTPNKYIPHQGEKEKARRLRTHLEKKPRRMWVMDTVMFGVCVNARRKPLLRTRFAKNLGCPVVLREV